MGDQIFTQHYTSGPPALPFNQGGDVDTIAVEKQEEWIKKRKVEQVTTKQIETRIKRQVMVAEDGTVVDDSGPQVTTNTTEDTETKREEHTEKKGGDGDEGTVAIPDGWVAVPGAVIVREKHEKKSNTRDETDERLETEEIHHLGPLTNEELEDAIENQAETGQLVVFRRQSSGDSTERQQIVPYSSGKRVVHQSRKHKRIIDQENTEEKSEEKDGKITTETTKHEHHEEVNDEELPDKDGNKSDTSSIHEVVKETRNNYTTAKDEDQVEYYAVPKGGNALTSGIKLGRGPRHSTLQTVQYDESGVPNPIPAIPSIAQPPPAAKTPAEDLLAAARTDALTKQPLDLEAEEETRKLETSRWLDSHFGSESSYETTEGGEKKAKKKMPVSQQVSSGGINVTMTSDPTGSDRYEAPNTPAPPPPPPPVMEPLATSRIYATTGASSLNNNRTTEIKTMSSAPRYASPHERVQVLPVGPDKLFMRNTTTSPPQSPSYLTNQQNSSSGYQSTQQQYRNVSSELNSNNSVTVKRAASFNPAAASRPWLSNNASREEPRHSFLNSMNNNPTSDYARPAPTNVYARPGAPAYAAPIIRRWPPPPNKSDEEDDIRTSTPVQQQQPQRTVIRLGGPDNYSTPVQKPSVGVNRTQSMFSPNNNNIRPQQQPMSTSNRMNIINSSLQSVPERERVQPKTIYDSKQQSGTYFIDVERSFSSLAPSKNEKPKISQTFNGKTPPPRPAPPIYYSTLGRTSESFRHPKSPPMFANDLNGEPPVRPVRRNKSKRSTIKTDSGTQTAVTNSRNPVLNEHLKGLEMFSRTLDRPTSKPIKQYYMGEDPFSNKQRSSVSPVRTLANGHAEPVHQQRKQVDIMRSQTLPRQPSKPFTPVRATESPPRNNLSTSRNIYSVHDRSMNDSYRRSNSPEPHKQVVTSPKRSPSPPTVINRNKTGITGSVVNRSQSFHVENQTRRLNPIQPVGGPSRLTTSTTPLNRTNLNSPLYKSTSFLNRLNSQTDQLGTLKSPGIVTSISKSQLDLTNSNLNSSSALYTLPRRKSPARNLSPIDITPPQPVAAGKVQSGISDRLAQLSPTSDLPRGETYSSMHRRKMQAASGLSPEVKTDQELSGQLSFQASTKTAKQPVNQPIQEEHEPEAKSLKDRIAMLETAGIQYGSATSQTLPRVTSGKTKAPPPPPPPRGSSALTKKPGDLNDSGELKKEKFLQGLLNTAPELFMHIHGDENLKDIHVKRDDIIDGKNSSRPPRTPSPPPPTFNNRVFTSTPTNTIFNKPSLDSTPSGRGVMTPPPPLFSAHSPFGSQHDLALRRGSLNSTGSGSIIPAVRIPPPVNYSETVRIKSNQDPDSQSDTVQSYSKRVQPFVDGFSSETKQSSQQTTLTRSEYVTGSNHALSDIPSSSPFQIRPQQSGGVIISVRGSGQ